MSGLDHVAEAIENPAPAGGPIEPAPPEAASGGGLPDNCPVVPLGVSGATRYYLDELGQVQGFAPREHTTLGITALYGRKPHLLREHFPKTNENKEVIGWQVGAAVEALMGEAARQGPWSPTGKVRGPGAWPDEKDGEVILHCGDAVLVAGKWRPCGMIGQHVYPAYPPVPRPSEVFAPAGPNGPGAELLELFKCWNWRQVFAPELLLGGVCCQIMGGALPWRPTIWVCGEGGLGKSALHVTISQVHGESGVITTADASEAGLRQSLKFGTLPVLFDEMEPDEDPRKVAAVIALARRASSGSMTLRGSAGHVEYEFVVRSTFMFSSVLVPPLLGTERSRIAILDLMPLDRRARAKINPARLCALGAALRRRLLDQWPRFPEVFAAYRTALMENGHNGRGGDTYGTLLACMHLVLHERSGFEPGELEQWAAQLPPGAGESIDVDEPDHVRCLTHLLSAAVDAYRSGVRRTVGQWIEQALGDNKGALAEVNNILETFGIKVVRNPRKADTPEKRGIYVATTHSSLGELFAQPERIPAPTGRDFSIKLGPVSVNVKGLMKIIRFIYEKP